jgi:P22 coat protein - gene protein 5
MANQISTSKSAAGVVAKVFAGLLADKVQFVKSIDKEDAGTFGENFKSVQPGDTIQVSKPARFNIRSGNTFVAQDIVEERVPLVINQKLGIDVTANSNEIATDIAIKAWAKRILEPAASRLAQEVERVVLAQAVTSTSNFVGTPGTPVNSFLTYAQATQKLDEYLAPMDDKRKVLINPAANTASVDALKGLFQSSEQIAKQYKTGYMGTTAGFDFMRNNLLPTITNGTAAGAITVTTTSTEGATTLALTGTGTQTLVAGQVFTIAGVFAVHPITKVSLGYLAQFVVLANNTAVAGAYTGLTFSVGGANYVRATNNTANAIGLQNVSALPTAAAVVTPLGTASTAYTQNIAFHPSSMRFCSVPLVMPSDVSFKAMETVDGITVRVLQQYQVADDTMPMRLDILFGSCVVRPEWLCRLTN